MDEATTHSRQPGLASIAAHPWVVVGLLWFCGFFNYADRQALSAVNPALKREFVLSDAQIGFLGSAFTITYALASPFTGFTVDLLSRRLLISLGLGIWSIICAATGLARSFLQLVFLRGAEGLGESFYFPASMSMIADYHGPRTRSRAMSTHQTSVYLGTAGGWYLGGWLGELYGWRSSFWVLGAVGLVYAALLGLWLVEPMRGSTLGTDERASQRPIPAGDRSDSAGESRSLVGKLGRITANPAAAWLLCVFLGANFVAMTFLTWLPTFLFREFELGLSSSSLTSAFWPLASLPGAACGGVLADWAVRRSRGGRIRTQSLGLILAAPFVLAIGWSRALPVVILALIGAGLCKGIYDANIFASLFDVVPASDRGTAAGLMNTVGWIGAFVAPTLVGFASDRFGLGVAISSTAAIYLIVGLLALRAAGLAEGGPATTAGPAGTPM
jgi:sugar phosphate permease